jgi:uncharacterized protein (DUF4415 family)
VEFPWDEQKNRANRQNISFETAMLIWDDPYHLTSQDREVEGEPRRQHGRQLAASGTSMDRAIKNRKTRRVSRQALSRRQKKELAALAALPDQQIDASDIPELPPGAWKDAVRGRFYRPLKQAVSMRLDADVVAWLKLRGKGYQTRANSILRERMLADTKRA